MMKNAELQEFFSDKQTRPYSHQEHLAVAKQPVHVV